MWAFPFPYSPQDPSLVANAPVGYQIDAVELLPDGTTTPGRLSGQSFDWSIDGVSVVFEDGDARHRITTLAQVGDERQAIVEYTDGGFLVLLSAVRVALGDATDSTLAADLLPGPQVGDLQIWQDGINSWPAAAVGTDGRLLLQEIFGYVFPSSTTSFLVFGNPPAQQACPIPTVGCFSGGPQQLWDWSSNGNLITRSLVTSALTRVRTWEVLSYQVGGQAVVVESAVWTFAGADPEFVVTPRINTLELLDLGLYPAELANSPDLN